MLTSCNSHILCDQVCTCVLFPLTHNVSLNSSIPLNSINDFCCCCVFHVSRLYIVLWVWMWSKWQFMMGNTKNSFAIAGFYCSNSCLFFVDSTRKTMWSSKRLVLRFVWSWRWFLLPHDGTLSSVVYYEHAKMPLGHH